MKAVDQLKQYGFRITPWIENLVGKWPADVFNHMEIRKGKRIARVSCESQDRTEIIITQEI